jgi:segregation and condensation protein A
MKMDGNALSVNDLEQHLLFHKALIDDQTGTERIDNYLDILKENQCGERMSDPVDEAIRSVFSLVFENGMDPWEIDLREFVRQYSAKVRENTFDMIVAGKLVLMAWRVLRMQSDRTLLRSEEPEEQVDEIFEFDEFGEEPEKLFVPDLELREAFRREPTRPVTMIELLDAFEDARAEVAVAEERERVRAAIKAAEPKRFDNKAHDEDDEKVVDSVWNKIEKIGTGAITITDLYTDDIMENIRVFVSVLHLVRDGRLAVWQDVLPYGEIFVEIKVDWMSGTVEDGSPEQPISAR